MKHQLNPQQQKAVTHKRGPLLVIAGAGSGKTRVLTSRLVHLIASGVPGNHIVAITFTNKAAHEMADRLQNTSSSSRAPFVGTFHSFGAHILRRHAQKLGRTSAFSIFDGDDSRQLIKSVVKELGFSKESVRPLVAASLISRVKYELLDPQEELSLEYALVFRRYEEELQKSNAFDFDDLICKVVDLFSSHAHVLRSYQEKFTHILVDEFQDTNPAQYALVKHLASTNRNLTVVGDDAQSIYSFRGSDFRNFLNFDTDWPDARVITLAQNYRSTQTIITAASALIDFNHLQKRKELWTDNDPGHLIEVAAFTHEDSESAWVTGQLLALPKTTVVHPAILYRTNAQSRALEQALIGARIPYALFGGVKFYERREIKDVVAALRVAVNPRDRISTERLRKLLRKKIGEGVIPELPRKSRSHAPHELIGWFLKVTDYFSYLERAFSNHFERAENVRELIVFAGQFQDLGELVEHITLLQTTDLPNEHDVVAQTRVVPYLMTIHLAKGLEFDRVYVIGCAEGTLPHHRSLRASEELEEERRLMYVAMTRARRNLTLSFSHIPSRFLYEIPPELTSFHNHARRDGDSLPDEDEIYIE